MLDFPELLAPAKIVSGLISICVSLSKDLKPLTERPVRPIPVARLFFKLPDWGKKNPPFKSMLMYYFISITACSQAFLREILLKLPEAPYHLTKALAQVRPPPKAVRTIRSPFLIDPSRTASSKAMAAEAEEMLPYLWTVM